MNFSYTVTTKKGIDKAIEDIAENLKKIGFGVLEILDFKNLLQDKGLEFDWNYKQMQVCNPELAKQVLEANPDLGLLLPCTIAVYQKDNENFVSLAKPSSVLYVASDDVWKFIGKDIEENLIQVIENSK
ncbi:MAG: DUF302 domain-containing protein [Nitrosopumilus sp.]|uniref:DUF302 domain-containing protein n=1 Tax=Nitrosopumilus sp. TaxID=2024843 RepID=UPI00292F0090|nr:DUF302 domain-containing protein [Nitrosopumilus sp.]